ncbi:hypothetical protein NPIL_378981 [Nephila pilipes]|uniref:Uncharacterized protein n=1 Tax=Nephila pilipes TaxID=299642 RepID=A0A8X6TJU5_NEPPI|nr:hypothetical protein NPIL_378981 [Nephila pilipes]
MSYQFIGCISNIEIFVFLATVSCAVHHVIALGLQDAKYLTTDNVRLNLNSEGRNLPLEAARSLSGLENLQNVRLNLEASNHKNVEQRLNNPLRGFQAPFQSINSLVNNPSAPTYFVNFSLKQNVSNGTPSKHQQTIFRSTQQTFIQQPNIHNQKQTIDAQHSLNNQQLRISQEHSFNLQDSSRNQHISSNDQQIPINQRFVLLNQHLQNQQKSIHHQDFVRGQQHSLGQQQVVSGKHNFLSAQENSNSQHSFFRKQNAISPSEVQQMFHQQQRLNQEQTHNQQSTDRFNNQMISQQYSRPQEHTQGQIRTMPVSESRSHINNEYQQIQIQTDKLFSQIKTDALKKYAQPVLFDEKQSRNVPIAATSHQTIVGLGLANSVQRPVSAEVHESMSRGTPHLPSSGSVKQHLKTPFVAYDFSHDL